jgi:hypothetical protein
MDRPDDPRQTTISDLSKVIPCLVVSRFEHSTLVQVRGKKHNHSDIGALIEYRKRHIFLKYYEKYQ